MAAVAMTAGAAMAQGSGGTQTATIGHNLEQPPNARWENCDNPCTNQITGLPSGAQAADGITAPFNGTIVTWRIRCGIPDEQEPQACDEQDIRLWVLRDSGGGEFTFVAPSDTETLQGGTANIGIQEFSASLPIQKGDFIALELLETDVNIFWTRTSNAEATYNQWSPSLAQGDSGPPDSSTEDIELLINADVETVPAGGVDTGGGSTAEEGGTPLLPFALAGLALLATLALLLRRRLSS